MDHTLQNQIQKKKKNNVALNIFMHTTKSAQLSHHAVSIYLGRIHEVQPVAA